MQTEYLSNRQLNIPAAAPEALGSLLSKAQEGVEASSGLDTVRWVHDSLAFLTEFFASFSVGALKTVGPHSAAVEDLLGKPASLDRAERLLAQAFIDWKAHPHHPAYESLREAFFLSSRLQSSRTAPRRHTRWLGVDGRAVSGLEQLSRWSRRIDLMVSGGDEAGAQEQVRLYLPVLWIWTDALESFFGHWSLELSSEASDGRLSFSGSASRDDIRLELVPAQSMSGLKSRFVVGPDGTIGVDGFAHSSNGLGAVAPPSEETPPPAEADIEVVFDEESGTYLVSGDPKPAEAVEPTPVPDQAAPVPDLTAPTMPPPAVPDLAAPVEPAPPVPDLTAPTMPPPAVPDLAAPVEPAPPVPDLTAPTMPPPAVPDLAAPVEPAPPVPDLTAPTMPPPAVPDLAAPVEPAPPVPDLTAPTMPPPAVPDSAAPVEPAPAAPDLAAPVEPAPPVPDLTAPTVPPPTVPDLAAPVEPAPPVPDLTAPTVPPPAVPDLAAPVGPAPPVPDLAGPVAPDLAPAEAPPATVPDLAVPPMSTPPAPDFVATPEAPESATQSDAQTGGLPAFVMPDLSTPTEAPLFSSEGADQAVAPDTSGSEVPLFAAASANSEAEPPLFAGDVAAEEPEVSAEPTAVDAAEEPEVSAEPTAVDAAEPEPSVEPAAVEAAQPEASVEPGQPEASAEPAAVEPAQPEVSAEPPLFAGDEAEEPAQPEPSVEPAVEEPAQAEVPAEATAPETAEPQPPVEASLPEVAASETTQPEVPSAEPVAPQVAAQESAEPEPVVPAPDFGSLGVDSIGAEPAVNPPEFGSTGGAQEAPAAGSLGVDTIGQAEPATEPAESSAGSLGVDTITQEASAGGFGSLMVDTIGEEDAELPAAPIATAMSSQWAGMEAFSAPEGSEKPLFSDTPLFSDDSPFSIQDSPGVEPTVETNLLGPAAEPTVETSAVAGTELEPTVETAAVAQTAEPEPAEVSAEPEPEPSAEPAPEPSAEAAPEPSAEPAPEPSAEPAPEPSAESAPEPSAESAPEPEAEPEPEPEPAAEPAPESSSEPSAEPVEPTPPPPPPPPFEPTQGSGFSVPEASGSLFAAGAGDSLFSPTTDGPLFSTDASADQPLFATSNEESVEVPVPVAQAPEMGAQAEEILDDDYEFSSEAGPASPQWSGWSVDEREDVQAVCETILADGQGQVPTGFATPLFRALGTEFSKLQVVLGPGCGKSRMARDLQMMGKDGPLGPALLVDWNRCGSQVGSDGAALLSVYFHLRDESKAQEGGFVVPEPEAVAQLAAAVPKDGFRSSFQRLLGQLSVLNPGGLTLLFDEPTEDVRAALAEPLPGKLRVVSFVSPLASSADLGQVVDLQAAWPGVAEELFGPSISAETKDPTANLLRIALLSQLKAAGHAIPATLDEVGKSVLESPAVTAELLACLALEREFVSLDDLDQWFIPADAVVQCVENFPSLFQLQKTRLSPLLGLSHPSLDAAALELLAAQRQRAANALLGWVTSQLQRTSSDKYGGLQVREIVFRNFCRLYHFALLSGSPEVMEWVARNKELQRNRVVLTSHLETPANRWDLQQLLNLLCEILTKLVDTGNCDDLRDEKAWALSNLALNQMNLGLLPTANEGIQQSLELFETLVEKEQQQEFKPALATTCYRASQIADRLGDAARAKEYADKAVQNFVDLVEDHGKVELQPRLGIALAHRGRTFNAAGDQAAAMKDLQRAASLLGSVPTERQKEHKRSQIEVELELALIYLKTGDAENAIKEAGKAVQLAVQAVEEMQLDDLTPLLASCHATRAKCYLKLNEGDRAQRDVSKSITLRNLAVDEGRLDQRSLLATDHLLRAKINSERGQREDAVRDLNQAVEFFEQLASEGRSDAPEALLKSLIQRSELLLAVGQAGQGVEDLGKASELLEKLPETPETQASKLSVLDALLNAYLQDGRTADALTVSKDLLTTYQAAGDWEKYAGVQMVRGRALDVSGDYQGAHEAFNQAVGLVTKLLEEGQTDPRLSQLAESYLGVAGADFKLDRAEHAAENAKRAIDVLSHLFQARGAVAALPRMLVAYSLHAKASSEAGRVPDAFNSIKSGFDVLKYLESQNAASGLEMERAELHRQRATALLGNGDANGALQDTEEAMRNFLATRQQNQRGPWNDELARTWILRSKIFFILKDFNQAEQSVTDAINHFDAQVKAGKPQYFDDLMAALMVRAENAGRAGKIDRVLEEYGRMLQIASAVAQSGAPINVDLESARILERRAVVYREQSLFNEAYADFERVIGLYRKLVSEGRGELAPELTRIHLERGAMISGAGHAEHAVNDFSEAINVAKALVGQGSREAVRDLAQALQSRADCYKAANKPGEALQDLEGAIGFQMQLAQHSADHELLSSLGRALLSQGGLRMAFNQLPQAAESFDTAIQIFTRLVEQEQLKQYSGDLAQGLISRVSLSPDKSDPAMRQVLIRAVLLVTARAKDGEPVAKEFTIDCLKTVVDLLSKEDFDTVGDLIDALLALIELVVTDGKGSQDFVKLTDLLLAASSGLIDDRRTARRPHFLALACVSCNREIQIFGQNSLPRLVYCLYELGQALERSKPPAVLNYIGSSFALLGELAGRQENSEDFVRELKMMVTTWRSLPPQVPALANVSRHMLSQLLRLT